MTEGKRMKASDYIVEFLIHKGITDVFGYPGGMVTHLMDSFSKYADRISAHVTYHEQGAAFAACGYAQTSGKVGVAYATSGPGATNLITGICDAFFDSVPTLFITGQVNANEAKGEYPVRQRGFQETDIVSIVKPITKYAVYVESAEQLQYQLEKAYHIAVSGRTGPVLLDIPMNIFRAEVEDQEIHLPADSDTTDLTDAAEQLSLALSNAAAPAVLVGNGVKITASGDRIRAFVDRLGIPAVTSMTAFDVLNDDPLCYGFIGAYGSRTGNFIAAKSDLIIAIGSRMDIRQVGVNREKFAPDAKIIRFDVDKGELEYRVHQNEIQFCMPMEKAADVLDSVRCKKTYGSWIDICNEIRTLLSDADNNPVAEMIQSISHLIPEGTVITTDVGQNQVWVAQSFRVKENQKVLFSGGHGAMGYSLPAAIGACYANGRKPVFCITGDGGMQMNIQELQLIAREGLPVKIIVLNNNALGMIRHFQEMYFEGRYYQTKPEGGYTAPNFARIAEAYGIRSCRIDRGEINTLEEVIRSDFPALAEVIIKENTYVVPKLKFGNPNQDQEPLIDRELYNRIMEMKP